MGYSQEIIAYQNPYSKTSQLFELYHHLINDGWSLKTRIDNTNIQYSVNPGDWLELPIEEVSKFEDILKNQADGNLWISFMLNSEKLDRIVWLIQSDNIYSFELQIASNDELEIQWFENFHTELIKSIKKLSQIIHIEWRSDYNNKIIRVQTDLNHEGVLVLCSSNRLKEYFRDKEFNYEYPHGLNELITEKIIIAIDSKDYEYTTILEKVEITKMGFGFYSSIEFTDDDEMLILHHGDFTMICNNHKGDYKSYGWKNIIALPIGMQTDQGILIGRPKDEADKRLIFQFKNIEQRENRNYWMEYEGIPTHNIR